MKEIIQYYYNFDIKEISNFKNGSTFTINGDIFYFVFFNRTVEELEDLIKIINELKNKGVKVHDIIINRENNLLTKVNDLYYILMKINILPSQLVTFTDIISFSNKLRLNPQNSKLYRNNWGELWSRKIDYFEYQIKEIGKDKKVVVDSFSYYIGLAENAISYVNKVNKVIGKSEFDNVTLAHRRIFLPNIALNFYNPLSFIFDLEVRDIAEYLKCDFFNDGNALLDLQTYLKIQKLSIYEYHMLYARLLYPSYYFDLYDDVMNNNGDEEKLIKIIAKVHDYELFLKKAYFEITKYTNLEHIDWILKVN